VLPLFLALRRPRLGVGWTIGERLSVRFLFGYEMVSVAFFCLKRSSESLFFCHVFCPFFYVGRSTALFVVSPSFIGMVFSAVVTRVLELLSSP